MKIIIWEACCKAFVRCTCVLLVMFLFLVLFSGAVGLIISSLILNKMLIHGKIKNKKYHACYFCYTKSKYVAFSQ